MRVLVTGHLGYLGSAVVPALLEAGHVVEGLDAGLFDECALAADGESVAGRRMDVRDVAASDLEGFDAVVHLAGLSNDPLGEIDGEITDQINHRAAVRLAELARAAGVGRFVFSSTCSVYGEAGEDWVDESSALRPLTPYARSKAAAEAGIGALAEAGFSPVLLRNATAYGASPRMRFDLVLNNLVAWACATGCVRLKSRGDAWRPLAHVGDIARTVLWAVDAPRQTVHGEAFNVGRSEENYRVRDLAALVAEALPGCRVETADGARPDRRSYRVDCGKLAAAAPELSFEWTARGGIEEVAALCIEACATPAEFEGPRYSRVESLKTLCASGRVGPDLRWSRRRSARGAL